MSEATAPQLPQWITDHLQRYLDTNGADGHMWDSKPVGGPGLLPTLLLTTSGRRSGKPITMPLIYGEADGSYIIVASKGGAPQHPGWYLNLAATPPGRGAGPRQAFSGCGPHRHRARAKQPVAKNARDLSALR